VHDWLAHNYHSRLTCVMGLWHDAGEAYHGDMPSPLKRRYLDYRMDSVTIQRVCRLKLLEALPAKTSRLRWDEEAIKKADSKSCLYEAMVGWPEAAQLDPVWVARFGAPNAEDAKTLAPAPWVWRKARAEFLKRLSWYVNVT
jgi:hypothetical protein